MNLDYIRIGDKDVGFWKIGRRFGFEQRMELESGGACIGEGLPRGGLEIWEETLAA